MAVASRALAAALCSQVAQADPVRTVEHLLTKCDAEKLVSGPGEDVWFSGFRHGGRPGAGGRSIIGRMTPQGTVSEFSTGIPAGVDIRDLVAGPDGNLWFTASISTAASARRSSGDRNRGRSSSRSLPRQRPGGAPRPSR